MNNKSMILAGSLVILLCFVATVWWILSPAWVLLFPHPLSEQTQQNVLLLLNQHNIEYKIDSVKNTVLVKSSVLKKAQVMLAENGQPEEHTTGLEVFNSSDYGLSEFAQSVNYQRGMEEELARTIKKLKGIKNVRVHLTIKKDSLFEDRKQPPKATVVIKSQTDDPLNSHNIQGIQEIVAAAVPNLEPQRVVIVTDTGQVLSSSNMDETKDTSGLEDKYTRQISYLLNGILSSSEYKVTVTVAMDYKKKVTVEENYFPDKNTGVGFLAKRKTVERPATENSLGAVPQSNKNDEVEYLFSKERSEIVYATGEVKKIAVGIVISKPLAYGEKENIERLIFNSLGMVESRGDKISVLVTNKSDEIKTASVAHVLDMDETQAAVRGTGVDKFLVEHKMLVLSSMLILLSLVCLMIVIFVRTRSYKSENTRLDENELNELTKALKEWARES